MLPAICHVKKQKCHEEKTAASCLLITPFQVSKDDIYSKTKEFIEAAGISSALIYENDSKEEQIERLKTRKILMILLSF